jgi:hypothetical protein
MALHLIASTTASLALLSLTPLSGAASEPVSSQGTATSIEAATIEAGTIEDAPETTSTGSGPTGRGVSAAEADIITWAAGRFELAGLALPVVEVSFSTDAADCGGHEGLYRRRDGAHLVTVCTPDDHPTADDYRRRTLIHELAHAWDQSSLNSADRDGLLPVLNVEDWYEADARGERGIERLAETFVFGLLDEPRRVLLIAADCADVYADFVGITGSAPIGPIPPICVAPSV